MMRSRESRGDTCICDEPLYAHYLKNKILHPGAREIVDPCEYDGRSLAYDLPGGKPIFDQRH